MLNQIQQMMMLIDINDGICDPSIFLEQSIEIQQQVEEEESEEEHITVEEFEDYLDDS